MHHGIYEIPPFGLCILYFAKDIEKTQKAVLKWGFSSFSAQQFCCLLLVVKVGCNFQIDMKYFFYHCLLIYPNF